MAYRSSSSNTGTSNPISVPVPTGVQANDIVVLVVSTDNNLSAISGSWPAGFTNLDDQALSGPDGQRAGIAWKRLTGADTGSYTLANLSGFAQDWVATAYAFSGRDTTNPPVKSTATVNTTANTSPVTASGSTVTALAGDDILWAIATDDTVTNTFGTGTAPASYTKRIDVHDTNWSWVIGATRDNVGAGATGTVSGSFTLTSGAAGYLGWLIRIPVAGATTPAPGERVVVSQAVMRAATR